MLENDGLIELIIGMQDAAMEPALWPQILERFGYLLNGARVQVGMVGYASGMDFHATGDPDPALHRLMAEQYHTPATNPGLHFMMFAPPGTIGQRESIQSDQEMVRTPFYHDIMRPYDVWHAATGAAYRGADYLVPFGAVRRRSAGLFTATELKFMHLLMPHLHRSMRLMRRVQDLEARAGLGDALLDRSLHGVIVTDAAGRIGTTNGKADTVLAESDGLLIRDGVLTASLAPEAAKLARLVRAAGGMPGRAHRSGDVMPINRPSRRRPLPLAITPLGSPAPSSKHPFSVSIAFNDPDRVPEIPAEKLARLYRLTQREAAVAALLLQGQTPDAAAASLAVKISTIRTHIQHLYMKTGTSRLPELLNLLLRTPSTI